MIYFFKALFLKLFWNQPKYCIVEYRGKYFPAKATGLGYKKMLKGNEYNNIIWWERQSFPESVSLKYESIHEATIVLRDAIGKIERLDNVKLVEVDSRGFEYFDKETYHFDTEQRVYGDPEEMELEEYMDYQFKDEDLSDVNIGAG